MTGALIPTAHAGWSAAMERRAPWVAAILVFVVGLLTMTSDPIGVFNDDGLYLLTAKALADGHGYVYPHLPGMPPAIHYPPLWPMLLAVALKVGPAFPANIGWLKLINPVITACGAATGVVVGRRLLGLPWWVAFGGAVAATVTVPVMLLTNLLLSEPLFLLLLLPTLVVTERMVREGGLRYALGAAALIAILMMVRTLGGVVLVSGTLLLARERRWKELAVFTATAVLLLMPVQMFVWRAAPTFPDELRGSYGPYLEWVVDGYRTGGLPFLRAVVAKNVGAAWAMLGIFLSPLWDGPVRHVLASLGVLTFVSGLVALAPRGRAPVTALAIAGYLAVVIAWPFWVDRFLWVMWSLLMLIALAGAATLVARLRGAGRPRAAWAVVAVVGVLALGHTTYNARGLSRGWESSASREMTGAGLRLARHINQERAFDGELIAAELAPLVAIYTGLQVLPLEILLPRDHVVEKTLAEHVAELERIDRRFHPAAYVVMRAGPFYPALLAAKLDSGRTLIDVSPQGAVVHTLQVQLP